MVVFLAPITFSLYCTNHVFFVLFANVLFPDQEEILEQLYIHIAELNGGD
jgi:hypothetical protein